MSLQIYEASDYDKKEFERILSECNVSEDDMKFHAAMIHMCGNDPRINPVSCPMRKEIPRNGKLPYVGRERSRKYGDEKLLYELAEKYGVSFKDENGE